MHPRIKEIYAAAAQHAAGMRTHRRGFRIFSSPVRRRAFWLVGWQPGGKAAERGDKQIPRKSDLVSRHYLYSVIACGLLQHAERSRHIPTLVLADLVFFRSPTRARWGAVPGRQRLEDFSIDSFKKLVGLLRPQHLIMVGTHAASRLLGKPMAVGAGVGRLNGVPVSCVPHFSARYANEARYRRAVDVFRKVLPA